MLGLGSGERFCELGIFEFGERWEREQEKGFELLVWGFAFGLGCFLRFWLRFENVNNRVEFTKAAKYVQS